MFCPKCGSRQADDSKFCSECGSMLNTPEQTAYNQQNTIYNQPYNQGGTAAENPKFFDYYKNAIMNYVNFKGRTSRKEYWMFVLANIVVAAVLGFVGGLMQVFVFDGHGSNIISMLYSLFILLPGISIAVRRLHDIDKSGWWYLVSFIPLIGTIWFIVLLATRGTEGPNRFDYY